MKKLALLFVLVTALTFSFVYAVEMPANDDTAEPVISGEVIDDTNEGNADTTEPASGEEINDNTDESLEDDLENGSEDLSEEENVTLTGSKSTVWGAIIAIVIVLIIVAFVALFSKND